MGAEPQDCVFPEIPPTNCCCCCCCRSRCCVSSGQSAANCSAYNTTTIVIAGYNTTTAVLAGYNTTTAVISGYNSSSFIQCCGSGMIYSGSRSSHDNHLKYKHIHSNRRIYQLSVIFYFIPQSYSTHSTEFTSLKLEVKFYLSVLSLIYILWLYRFISALQKDRRR